jgi:cysteinyl-tRNA synthetase
LYDDLNMPRAMASLWDLARDEKTAAPVRRAAAAKADEILGLDLLKPVEEVAADSFVGENGKAIRIVSAKELSADCKQALAEKVRLRQKARVAKDWAIADTLRKELVELNATVKDLPDGSAEVTVS